MSQKNHTYIRKKSGRNEWWKTKARVCPAFSSFFVALLSTHYFFLYYSLTHYYKNRIKIKILKKSIFKEHIICNIYQPAQCAGVELSREQKRVAPPPRRRRR